MNSDAQTAQWAMILHFSQLAGYIIPLAGLLAPILIWQLKKQDMPELDIHGRIVMNWLISALIYAGVCALLSFILIGVPLAIALAVMCVAFPIIGGIKAGKGEVWRYPLSLPVLG